MSVERVLWFFYIRINERRCTVRRFLNKLSQDKIVKCIDFYVEGKSVGHVSAVAVISCPTCKVGNDSTVELSFRFGRITVHDNRKRMNIMSMMVILIILILLEEFSNSSVYVDLYNTSTECGETFEENRKIYGRVLTRYLADGKQYRIFQASERKSDAAELRKLLKSKWIEFIKLRIHKRIFNGDQT